MKFKRLHRGDVEHIVVHHSATPADMDIGAAEIDQWHRQRGWLSIGYHAVIRRDGSIEQGRQPFDQGAHVAGYNDVSVGICLIGGVDDEGNAVDNFTEMQYEALDWLLPLMYSAYPCASACLHRDLDPTTECSQIQLPAD